MKTLKIFAVSSAIALTLAPGLSRANTVWHSTNGEVGYVYNPAHAISTKSRAEVNAEVAAARKDGTMWLALRGIAMPVRSKAPGLTRDEVLDQIRDETVSTRHARLIQ